jgi:hypothetical protein
MYWVSTFEYNGLYHVQQKVCEVLKDLSLKDIAARHPHNPFINEELIVSFYSHAIFGMIVQWIKGGF